MDKHGKPVDIVCVDPFKLNGQHIAKGEVLLSVEADLAKELAGNGRARLAKPDDIEAFNKAKKAAEKAAKQTAPVEA